MTHADYQDSRQIQSRWQKEQQLIPRKYQIPYNITSTVKSCYTKPHSIPSQAASRFKYEKIDIIDRNIKRKTDDIPIPPPMFCSKCHLHLTECACPNGIGQWWIHLQKRSHSKEKISKRKSRSNSIGERHVSFDNSLIDLSSIEQSNRSKTTPKPQYVLLDWQNRQSLLNFIRTTELVNKNVSTMSIEQLQELITHSDHIHVFNSMADLLLTKNKEKSLCHLYIDRFYYSNDRNTIPYCHSHVIADNLNLNQTLSNIQTIAILLGVKIDQQRNSFSSFRLSIKQRKSILNQQSLFLASKIPSHTYRHTSP